MGVKNKKGKNRPKESQNGTQNQNGNSTTEEEQRAKARKSGSSVASTSAGLPNPILDPFGEDKDYPDSEVVWRNARRIDNPYSGLYKQEEVPADIASEVMSGTLTDWDRIYQNKMIPSENGQGLEILSGQIRVLHMCVTRWKKHEKEYRNKARYEQILSLAEECGLRERVQGTLEPGLEKHRSGELLQVKE